MLKALEYIRNLESERNVIQIANLKWKALLNDKNQEIEKMNTFNDKLVKALEQEMQGCFGQKGIHSMTIKLNNKRCIQDVEMGLDR